MNVFKEENDNLLPQFKMELILDDDDHIQFYPGIDDLENCIIEGARTILGSLQNVPTVQVIFQIFHRYL